jgi:RNA polymerase sigma-70 factor (ECF subfamily)
MSERSTGQIRELLDSLYRVDSGRILEGYSAAAGAEVTRAELTGEAIRLGRLLTELRPEPEVIGLLSLMLLQESRHAARTGDKDTRHQKTVTGDSHETVFGCYLPSR